MSRLTALALGALAVLSLVTPVRAQEHLERRAQYVPIVYEAAGYYDQNAPEMVRVIDCETGEKWDPFIVSPTNDHGLAQYHLNADGTTLLDGSALRRDGTRELDPSPHGNDYYDPYSAIWGMAYLWSKGYQPHWMCW